jgi:hypothetical protein
MIIKFRPIADKIKEEIEIVSSQSSSAVVIHHTFNLIQLLTIKARLS